MIHFLTIPEHIQTSIVQKLNIEDFLQFQKSSKDSYHISNKIKSKFVVTSKCFTIESNENSIRAAFDSGSKKYIICLRYLKNLPVQFAFEHLWINGTFSQELCEIFIYSTLFSTKSLTIKAITCSSESFNFLIDSSNVWNLTLDQPISHAPKFLRIPAMKKIRELSVKSFIDDNDLLSLNMHSLYLYDTNISSSGINLMLKEWLKGDREIHWVYITPLHKNFDKHIMFSEILDLTEIDKDTNAHGLQNAKKQWKHIIFSEDYICIA